MALAFLLPGAIFLAAPEKAPELQKSGTWINSNPLTLKSLKGKIVLLDFWAFDCDPCLEAMPHVRELYRKYESRGLVVIGVHTPRTEDERNITKLRAAVERLDIRFPVVTDSSEKIWNDYRCDVWPTVFVIDRNGEIRYSRGGVTRIGDLESTIQSLLERQ
jgi:thiol-disulfide isomerase/thioredoxin